VTEAIKIPMREFFICDYGVYMVDSQTQYRYNKQAMSFFTSHNEHIPHKIVNSIQKAYMKRDYAKIRTELEKIYPNLLKGIDFANIFQIFYLIVEKTEHFAIDLNTEKYLPHMEAYSPIAIKNLYHTGNDAMKSIEKLSPPKFPKQAIPLGIALIIGIVSIAMIQNLPKWLRELNAEFKKPLDADPNQFILGLKSYLPDPHQFILGIKQHLPDLILGLDLLK